MIVKVTDEKQRIALDYLARRLKTKTENVTFGSPFTVFVTCKGNDAKGVILYKNYASGDIEMVCAGEPGWVTPEVLRFSLSYPFEQLNCNRDHLPCTPQEQGDAAVPRANGIQARRREAKGSEWSRSVRLWTSKE